MTHNRAYFGSVAVTILILTTIIAAIILKGFSAGSTSFIGMLLLITLFVSFWRSYQSGIRLSLTTLTISISLLWLWMMLSSYISLAKLTGSVGVIVLGALPCGFWLATLQSENNFWHKIWRGPLVVIALILAMIAWWQQFYLHLPPTTFFAQKNSFGAFLNLITLPWAAYFLVAAHKGWRRYLFLLSLLILFFTISIINSWGVGIGFALGLALIIVLLYRKVNKTELLLLISLALIAFLLDRLFVAPQVNTMMAVSLRGRLSIWLGCWELFKHSHWYGIGIYNFYNAYSHFMPLMDSSSGQYAHNDFIQLLIELGYPGIILLFTVISSTLVTVVCWLRSHPPLKAEIEVLGLFAGLLAITVHSFVSYNFYILPTTLLFGLTLGRMQQLIMLQQKSGYHWQPHKRLTLIGYRLILILIALAIFCWLASISAANYYQLNAKQQMKQAKFAAAKISLDRAAGLYDSTPVEYRRATLFIAVLERTKKLPDNYRQPVCRLALQALDRATELNSYQSLIPYARASLYVAAHDCGGKDWLTKAMANYRQALLMNPRLILARVAYIRLLEDQHKYAVAELVRKEGAKYPVYGKIFTHMKVPG